MWTHCMFCHGDLGRNEVVEPFPIGRRLAFDEARGRLWVVCRKCERWNLTPLEERWEAIEACERSFRETRTRVSTEEIGLARLKEGLELVRVGAPQRPEFAAWRYGDQFGRRRRRAFMVGGAAIGVVAVAGIAGMVTGVVSGTLLGQSGNFVSLWNQNRTVARLRTSDGQLLKIKGSQIERAELLLPEEGEGWGLAVEHRKGRDIFVGDEAFLLSGRLMTRVNRSGGKRKAVEEAVGQIEAAGHPEEFVSELIRSHAGSTGPPKFTPIDWRGRPVSTEKARKGKLGVPPGAVGKLDKPTRLALEMALHEEQERRALEGELAMLELAWQDAEEVAAIADDLLLPEGTDEFIEKHRVE